MDHFTLLRIPLLKRWSALISLPFFFSMLNCGGNGKRADEGPNGERIYQERCASCHGSDGEKGLSGAADLTSSKLSMEKRIEVIKNGKGNMIPYEGVLDQEQIRAVARYIDKFQESE